MKRWRDRWDRHGDAPDGAVLGSHAERAREAWRALAVNCTWNRGGERFALEGPGRGSAGAPLWPLSQVLAAAIDVAGLQARADEPPGHDSDGLVTGLRRGLERYRIKEAYGPNPGVRNRYYDDNCWIALDLLRLYELTGDQTAAADAKRIFGFVAGGEASGGGIRWVEHPRDSRNTCSTAPAEQVALRLHRLGGDPALRQFAARCHDFLDRVLKARDGLYWDRVDDDGGVDRTFWSYNQGVPLGAEVLWYLLDGDPGHLDAAVRTAGAALDLYGRQDRLWRQPAAFNGVFFRELLSLHAQRPDDRYLHELDSYLDRAWSTARDPRTGLILGGGIGRYEGGGTIDHAALVQLYALRSAVPG